jgi:undecaprenyl diphosphate synthase
VASTATLAFLSNVRPQAQKLADWTTLTQTMNQMHPDMGFLRVENWIEAKDSGRHEITSAARRLARMAAEGLIDPDEITPELISGALDTSGIPDPDLIIRTSGEMRVSNFLLWQMAYAELHVTPVLWPDFSRGHLFEAILSYQGRERRFGRVTA